MDDLSSIPTSELQRVWALIQCDRMLYSFAPEIESKMDERAEAIDTAT